MELNTINTNPISLVLQKYDNPMNQQYFYQKKTNHT